MAPTHRFFRIVRTIHLYLGVFSAPMLLFFAVTGGLQTFGLHETSRGSSYTPPAWLVSVAQLHKKQTLVVSPKRIPPPSAQSVRPATSGAAQAAKRVSSPAKNLLPMKIFFALIALGLLTSVLSGLCMAWRFSRRPGWFGAVLAGGIAVPLLLLLL